MNFHCGLTFIESTNFWDFDTNHSYSRHSLFLLRTEPIIWLVDIHLASDTVSLSVGRTVGHMFGIALHYDFHVK